MYLYLFLQCDEVVVGEPIFGSCETIHLLSPIARERGSEPTITLFVFCECTRQIVYIPLSCTAMRLLWVVMYLEITVPSFALKIGLDGGHWILSVY